MMRTKMSFQSGAAANEAGGAIEAAAKAGVLAWEVVEWLSASVEC
jgi:hypothetical protein